MAHDVQVGWESRLSPDFQVTDILPDRNGYALESRALGSSEFSDGYIEELNEEKLPLIHAVSWAHAHAAAALGRRGINLTGIRHAIGAISGAPVLPALRFAFEEDLAQGNGRIPFPAQAPELPASDLRIGRHEPKFNYVHLSAEAARRVDKVVLGDAVARMAADAALNGIVDVSGTREQWLQGNPNVLAGMRWQTEERQQYGEMLHGATVAKMAALTRESMGLQLRHPTLEADHPLAPYETSAGCTPESIVAAALTKLNEAAGFRKDDELGIYDPLIRFAVCGRDESARAEAAQVTRTASVDSTDALYRYLEAQPAPTYARAGAVAAYIGEICAVDTRPLVEYATTWASARQTTAAADAGAVS